MRNFFLGVIFLGVAVVIGILNHDQYHSVGLGYTVIALGIVGIVTLLRSLSSSRRAAAAAS